MKENNTSFIKLISSMLIFGTVGLFRRGIDMSSACVACFRGAAGALFLLLFCLLIRHPLRNGIPRKKVFMLALAGALMGFNWILLFEAYRYTTVYVATLCYYMEPTIVTLVSPLLFHEKLTGKKKLCVAVSLLGMVLVSGVLEGGLPAAGAGKGILFGLGAGVLYASVVCLNKLAGAVDVYERTLIELAAAAVVLLPYILLTEGTFSFPADTKGILLLLVLGLVHTGLAYALYFGSLEKLPAQTVAILSYVDPVSALLLSALFLGERLSLPSLLGAVLILGAAAVSEITLKKKNATDCR